MTSVRNLLASFFISLSYLFSWVLMFQLYHDFITFILPSDIIWLFGFSSWSSFLLRLRCILLWSSSLSLAFLRVGWHWRFLVHCTLSLFCCWRIWLDASSVSSWENFCQDAWSLVCLVWVLKLKSCERVVLLVWSWICCFELLFI